MLSTLNNIESLQDTPTKKMEQKYYCVIDYAEMYPNTFIRYHASDMILHMDSDAAYLV